jgi:hypothetical protein
MTHHRKFRFAVQHTHAPDGAAWINMARSAEDSGVSVFSMPDHLGDLYSPIPALAAVAAVTRTIKLSMFVLCNDNRHPGLLAKEIATLDAISNGRVELGLGAGWTRTEYDALGMTFDSPGTARTNIPSRASTIRSRTSPSGRVRFDPPASRSCSAAAAGRCCRWRRARRTSSASRPTISCGHPWTAPSRDSDSRR